MAHMAGVQARRGLGIRNKPACDRCRGQKLRCIWEDEAPKCRRCTRAETVCATAPRRPLGRPPSGFYDSASEQSFGWKEYQADPDVPLQPRNTDRAAATQSHDAAPPGIGFLSDDIRWSLIPGSPGNAFTKPTSPRSNSFTSPSPAMQFDLGEFLNDFSSTPANAVFGTNNRHDASSPPSAAMANHDLATPSHTIEMSRSPTALSLAGDVRMPMPNSVANEAPSMEVDSDYVKQLSDIQVALIHHPLHANSARSQVRNGLGTRVADLQLGRLFALTVQLRAAAERVTPLELEEMSRQVLRDNAMVLLALSCYNRLDYVYSQAVELLREVQRSDQKLDDSYQLMSGFAIDGFSLGACKEFQVSFVLQLCEQIRRRLSATMEKLRGDVDYPNKGCL
ncbi:hypothetical protein F5Y06DRAFT_273376 [Hypoxylon sp. FL0890]|nr:hypothetical protein F5Y06DRAFT_273376 [Hypoxylon sp. FL0890]